jgi:hypothetical protein
MLAVRQPGVASVLNTCRKAALVWLIGRDCLRPFYGTPAAEYQRLFPTRRRVGALKDHHLVILEGFPLGEGVRLISIDPGGELRAHRCSCVEQNFLTTSRLLYSIALTTGRGC